MTHKTLKTQYLWGFPVGNIGHVSTAHTTPKTPTTYKGLSL